MSKEMMVIALGASVIVIRTLLGVPGEWQTVLFVVSGIALVVVGFLLRGEAISRSGGPRPAQNRSYSFVESLPTGEADAPTPPEAPTSIHEHHKEGITSLN